MKNLLTACLPALALFALGGCAGTSALTSSEDDGVYYSSKDRTTAVVSAAPAQTQGSTSTNPDEATNPDYNGNTASSSANQNSGSTQYYDNTYSYMQGVPTSPGVNYYSPYSPYTSLSYGAASAYSWGGGYCGYSPYGNGFYDPYYSSFYSPYYGYRPGLSISFGFGRPYGYGGYGGYGFGSPYGYGYGSPYGYGGYGGFYDPYYYGGSFYGGYYGRGGYYGSSYNGGNYGYGGNYGNESSRNRTYGHRNDRSSDGRYSTGGGVVGTPGTTTGAPASGGRVRTSDGLQAPGQQPQPTSSSGFSDGRRTRSDAVTATPGAVSEKVNGSFNQPQNVDRADRPRYRSMDAAPATQPMMDASQGKVAQDESRNQRSAETMQPNNAAQPDRRRGGFFQNVFSQPQPANNGGGQQTADQSRQRSYSQPQQQQQQQQQSYEQPRQRSYEQPQRSYSAPSYGGGGGGGGNSGGGGGGGGRGRSH